MVSSILRKVFGSRNDRLVKQLGGIVKKINALEPQMQALSDADRADELAREEHYRLYGAQEAAAEAERLRQWREELLDTLSTSIPTSKRRTTTPFGARSRWDSRSASTV